MSWKKILKRDWDEGTGDDDEWRTRAIQEGYAQGGGQGSSGLPSQFQPVGGYHKPKPIVSNAPIQWFKKDAPLKGEFTEEEINQLDEAWERLNDGPNTTDEEKELRYNNIKHNGYDLKTKKRIASPTEKGVAGQVVEDKRPSPSNR